MLGPDHHGARAASSPSSAARRLGARLHALVAAGPRRRRHVHVRDDADPGRARTRSRSRTGCRGTRTTGPAGRPTAPTSPFTVPAAGVGVVSRYVSATHVLTITTQVRRGRRRTSPSRGRTGSSAGCSRGTSRPTRAGWSFRLHSAPEGGLAVDEEAILGGESFPLTLDPDGLPADVRRRTRIWPRTRRSGCRAKDAARRRGAPHRPARRRGVRRPRTAGRRHRRADPRRARRRATTTPTTATSASRGTAARRSWRCGRRRRRTSTCCVRLPARRRTRRCRCAATRRRLVGDAVDRTGTARPTCSRSMSTCRRPARS